MAFPTQRQLLAAALLRRGYAIDPTARTTKYEVYAPQRPVPKTEFDAAAIGANRPLTSGPHRVLLGRSAALRLTRATVADSFVVNDRLRTQLLAEGRAALAPERREG